MPIAELHEIPDLVSAIIKRDVRVIGYGWNPSANVVWPVRLEYCLIPQLQLNVEPNQPVGTPVKGLKALLDEDPQDTVIVVCSGALKAAYEKISLVGDFTVISYFSMEYLYPYLDDIRNVVNLPAERQTPKTSNRGIVVRGRVEGRTTVQICQKLAQQYPDAYLVASTWNDTDPEYVRALERVCSEVLLLDAPEFPGIQHKNYQTKAALEGLLACERAGVERVLLTRSDLFFFGNGLTNVFDVYLDTFDSKVAKQYGLHRRIVIGDTYLRKYIPYHPSDLFMYGCLQDLIGMWSASPTDPRPNDHKSLGPLLDPVFIGDVVRQCDLAENHVCVHWLKEIGWPLDYTVADSLAVYRDLFVVVDHAFTGAVWAKKYLFNHAIYCRGLKQCLTQREWTALYAGSSPESIAPIAAEALPWRDFRVA